MENESVDRRAFLKGAVAGSAAAVSTALPHAASAQSTSAPAAGTPAAAATAAAPAGYTFFSPDEAAFIEAVVDHMIPADALTARGTDLGIHIYIDRAMSSGWGKGERLYMQGPWKQGTGNQGYQLPLTPSEVYRLAIPAANAQCVKACGKTFEKASPEQRQAFLLALQAGKVTLENAPPARVFFDMLYQNVMEGMFADPVYGGNRDKAGWKLIGFPGVIATNQQNIEKFRDRKFPVNPIGIADMS
jgi:gluconate 2-dehydrogenase gamma chain